MMYANPQSDHFFPYSNYVFLRKSGNEMLLVAVNFGTEPAEISVIIPIHAFDFLDINEQKATATDLLTGEKMSVQLAKDGNVGMTVGAFGARVWKFKMRKTKK